MPDKTNYQDLKADVIGNIPRQIKPEDSKGAQITIGPNHPLNWNLAPARYPIVGVDPGGDWFEIDDDGFVPRFNFQSSDGTPGRLYVVDSTANDNAGRKYDVLSASAVGGKTRIVTSPGPGSAVADGYIDVDETLTLPVEYELELPENSGAAPGSRGETIEWGLPAWLKPELELTIKDHDHLVLDWLARWKAERLWLRIFQWGEWTAVGRIGKFPLQRPIKDKFQITLLLRGLRRYSMPYNHQYVTVVGVGATAADETEILNVPFQMASGDLTAWLTHTELYGSEVL